MNEFVVIKVMNEATLRLLKSKNENYEKNEKLKEYFKDEAFFFKIDKEKALKVLIIVGVSNDKLEETYQKIISKNMYDTLVREGKINNNDNLIVKYN